MDHDKRVSVALTARASDDSVVMQNGFFGGGPRGSLMVSALVMAFGVHPAAAGPLEFLRRVGHSIAHPHHDPTPSPSSKKGSGKHAAEADPKPEDGQNADAAPQVTPVPQIAATPASTPRLEPARTTSSVPPAEVGRADLPYGVPVSGKPGFVISPYSPGGGYVDIRGYPSGTAVKDPYTGKVFLTP